MIYVIIYNVKYLTNLSLLMVIYIDLGGFMINIVEVKTKKRIKKIHLFSFKII